MKVKNQSGTVLHVPDDWDEEVLREKSLTVFPKPSESGKLKKASSGKAGKSRRSAIADYEAMPLLELKALARQRKLRSGRAGKKRLAQLLAESDA